METEPKLRLEDLRTDDSIAAPALKPSDEGPADVVVVDACKPVEEMLAPSKLPIEITPAAASLESSEDVVAVEAGPSVSEDVDPALDVEDGISTLAPETISDIDAVAPVAVGEASTSDEEKKAPEVAPDVAPAPAPAASVEPSEEAEQAETDVLDTPTSETESSMAPADVVEASTAVEQENAPDEVSLEDPPTTAEVLSNETDGLVAEAKTSTEEPPQPTKTDDVEASPNTEVETSPRTPEPAPAPVALTPTLTEQAPESDADNAKTTGEEAVASHATVTDPAAHATVTDPVPLHSDDTAGNIDEAEAKDVIDEASLNVAAVTATATAVVPAAPMDPVAEYRPDPPSEHADGDDDEDDDHAVDTIQEAPSELVADDDDELRIKDTATATATSDDVKPDPPQLVEPKDPEPVVMEATKESTEPVAEVTAEENVVPAVKEEDSVPTAKETAAPPPQTTSIAVEPSLPVTPASEKEKEMEGIALPDVPAAETTAMAELGKVVDVLPTEPTASPTEDNDEESYEEIIVEDDDEFIEYVDEILEDSFLNGDDNDDDGDEEVFTEVTYDSQDIKDQNYLAFGNGSKSSFPEVRPVIKSATQKALEEEAARKKAEADEAQRSVSFRIARQSSFSQKDQEFQQKLREEEAEHLRQEEERERQRILEQERVARIQAEEAAQRIAQQSEEALRERLELEEAQRRATEVEEHRRAAEAAAREKEAAEKARRQAEEAERNEREAKKRAMEEEVRLLEAKLAEAKVAAEEAKRKEKEEKKRLQAKIDARRKEKKMQRMSVTSTTDVMSPDKAAKATADPSSPMRAIPSPVRMAQSPVPPPPVPVAAAAAAAAEEANGVYYTVEQLRKQTVPGLDYKNREIYIHPNEYPALFGMPKAEFDQQPKWKKTQLKRKQKLF